jgi:hypothetical protein
MVYIEMYHMYGVALTAFSVAELFDLEYIEGDGEQDIEGTDTWEMKDLANEKIKAKSPESNLLLRKWPCCYESDLEAKGKPTFFLGCELNTTPVTDFGKLFMMMAMTDARTAVNKFFFRGKIDDNDLILLHEALEELGIEDEPIDMIIPDDCYSCT